ncbi:MAG: protease complex subunit PrcB family protein [Ignavibacteria bacterium]|nr:protease complex subunit PrcB family protein [Ignavibacteria bacterium]
MKSHIWLHFLIALTVVFISCSGKGKDTNTVQFESIMSRGYSSIDINKEVIINSYNDYMDLMKEVYAFQDQIPVAPEVDFKKNTIIGVFLGPRTTGGYSVNVESITESSDILNVNIVETAPGKNCVTTEAITKPFELVKIPKTDKMAVFKYKKVTNDCQ